MARSLYIKSQVSETNTLTGNTRHEKNESNKRKGVQYTPRNDERKETSLLDLAVASVFYAFVCRGLVYSRHRLAAQDPVASGHSIQSREAPEVVAKWMWIKRN